jgi:hypothetical protein
MALGVKEGFLDGEYEGDLEGMALGVREGFLDDKYEGD